MNTNKQFLLMESVLPPVPSRESVLGVNMSFMGGIIVDSPVYGKMPWWPSALSWCDYSTRQAVYNATKNETHQIIEVPNGLPLYDEPNQFYNPQRFPAMDWTNNEQGPLDPQFINLVQEVVQQGKRYIIAMDERVDHSLRIIPLVMQALTDAGLDQYGFCIPGYDAVFYGWAAYDIILWSILARQINPICYLGIEHNVGHIPLGEGGQDYQPGGRMSGYDVVLGEFGSDGTIHNDNTWQILGRMIQPYYRPPDQPVHDDPNPPFYLVDSPRGPRYYCTFETDNPYNWVRVNPNDDATVAAARDAILQDRNYFTSMGSRYNG